MQKMLDDLKLGIEQQEQAKLGGVSYSGIASGGVALGKIALGIAGLRNKTDKLPEVKSNYVIDPNLTAAASYATTKAFETPEDYGARIRLRNQRINQSLKGASISGGDRNFIAANEAAAVDAENVGNLQVDMQGKQMQNANLNTAANFQQMALFDRLNKSRDEMNAAEMNMKGNLFEIEQRNRNIAGAANLIASGMNDVSTAAGGEITNNAQTQYQKIALLNVLSKLGGEQQEKIQTDFQKKLKNLEFDNIKKGPSYYTPGENNTYSKLFS
jgi:hypothetical protein